MRVPKQTRSVERSYIYNAQVGSIGLMQSACVSLRTSGGRVCISLPIVGSKCLSLPFPVPNGTLASGCFSVCRKGPFGIPSGACVTISIAGRQIIRKCFGFC